MGSVSFIRPGPVKSWITLDQIKTVSEGDSMNMHIYRGYYKHFTQCLILLFLFYLFYQIYQIQNMQSLRIDNISEKLGHYAIVKDARGQRKEYNSQTHPFIFIGGHPRSGTTLVRAMLDSHQKIRCGEETRIIPRILQLRDHWYKSENEMHRLAQGGITDDVIDAAISSFVMETIVQHGDPADVLCNKDPLAMKQGEYLSKIFPNSKWIFMVRDGRAVIHSVIKRKITITGYFHDDPRGCLQKWNKVMEAMNTVCTNVGPAKCLVVYYEQLVLHPRRWMTIILDFLDIPWDEGVLSHHLKINKPGGVRVSAAERSSDQIVKPVNVEALTEWVGTFPEDVLQDMNDIAPMLKEMGYDPNQNPPNYGVPDVEVVNNTKHILQNRDFWEMRQKKMVEEMKKPETFSISR